MFQKPEMRRPQTSHLAATLILIFHIKIPEVNGLGKAGDPCTSHTDCDQLSFLACNAKSMTCECPQIPALPLLYFKGQCVSYVGGSCTKIKSPSLK